MTEAETISGEVTLPIAGEAMKVRVTVPAGVAPLSDLLPLFHELTSRIVDRAVERDAASGQTVSCRAGCGACCRQPVPVSPAEARAIVDLVDAMPEPRRGIIRARFAAGLVTMTGTPAVAGSDALVRIPVGERADWATKYMAMRVACPFLEDESCSIYLDRPTICREYLVTTPPENCAAPAPGAIRGVPLTVSVSQAVASIDRGLEDRGPLLLIESLAWVAAHPAPPPSRTGPALVEAVFAAIVAP